jgi:hypothetical protein
LLLASWLEQRVDPPPVQKPPAHWQEPQPATAQPRDTRETSPVRSQPVAAPETTRLRPPVREQTESPRSPETFEAAANPELPEEEPRVETHAELPMLQLGAAANLLAFASALAPIPGGELHVSVPLSASWALRGAAQAGHGSLRGTLLDEQGQTDANMQITTASLALSLHALTHAGDFELSLGAGVRLGFVHLAGEHIERLLEPTRAFAPWTGPMLSPRVSYRLSASLLATLSLEAGWMAVRVRVLAPHDTLLTELHGMWMLLSLGLDLAFLP